MNRILFVLLVAFNIASVSGQNQIVAYVEHQNYSGGYYFLSSFKIGGPPGNNYQLILDGQGNVVYIRKIRSYDFKIQPNGLISYNSANKFWLMDSTFTIVDSIYCKNGIPTDEHDFQVLPNGHFLLLGHEIVTEDLSSYNYFLHQGLPGSSNASVGCSVIQEQDVNKNVVFEWHSKDFFPFDDVDTFFLNSPSSVEWIHSNSVDMDIDGNILLSSRQFNEITKINRTDSSIMWRFGGKHNQFTYLSDTVPFYAQHDARRIANGHVTVYDDGYNSTSHSARALEYAIDEVNKTADLKWSYVRDSSMSSRAMGNVQRLSNSNTVVNYGDILGNQNVCFTVVDPSGAKVFEYVFPDSSMSYRVFYYASLPFQLHRPVISCFDSSGVYYLKVSSGYSSYQWSDGSSQQLLPVIDTGTYYVLVPYGEGGLLSSENFHISSLSNICGNLNGIMESVSKAESISVFPNPNHNQFTVDGFISTVGEIEIYNVLGEKVYSQIVLSHTSTMVNHKLQPGIYFVRVTDGEKQYSKKLVIE